MDNYLLIFFKYPEAGRVKTRLAQEIGAEKAAKLYSLFIEVTVERTTDRNGFYERLLFYTPDDMRNKMESWICRGKAPLPMLYTQIGTDLGERMCNALETAHSIGAKRAVIIGTDSPTLDKATIDEAFRQLEEYDVIIGPTVDGGYYLIGASLPVSRGLFEGIDWGSERVFDQTIERARKAGARYSVLPLHYDVDTLADLMALKQEISQMDVAKRGNFSAIYKMLVEELNF